MRKRWMMGIALAMAGAVMMVGHVHAEGSGHRHEGSGHKDHDHAEAAEEAPAVTPYPFDRCLVSRDPLGENPYVVTVDGQEVKFCCRGCFKKFRKDKARYMAIIASGEFPAAPAEGSGHKREGSGHREGS